jgi:isocitrate dehydrogenase
MFDVIVVPNLYGDILSDVASQLTGSVGLGVSSNIGDDFAMFEAVHGSAPDIAGRGIANPSGLLLAAAPMLVHMGQPEVAERIHNAWKRTIEEGIHTNDIYRDGRSTQLVGTEEFANAVIARLGKQPQILHPVSYKGSSLVQPRREHVVIETHKELVGIDVFVDWHNNPRDPRILGELLEAHTNSETLQLVMVTNRGLKVYPDVTTTSFCTDHWRCRYQHPQGAVVSHRDVLALLGKFEQAGLDFIKTEHLYNFDGQPGFSLGQGQ